MLNPLGPDGRLHFGRRRVETENSVLEGLLMFAKKGLLAIPVVLLLLIGLACSGEGGSDDGSFAFE